MYTQFSSGDDVLEHPRLSEELNAMIKVSFPQRVLAAVPSLASSCRHSTILTSATQGSERAFERLL